MIPARIGSQRLYRKNLREIAGLSLIVRATLYVNTDVAFC